MYQVMNEFDVPFSPEQEMLRPPGANKFHEKMMAESGLEMQNFIVGALVGGAISVAGSIIGGNKAASAARQQANMQNEAAARQLEYDTKAWEMGALQANAKRDHLIEEIEIKKRNENRVANWKDATNLQQYNYDMQIRNREQTSLNQQFLKSNKIYYDQLGYNRLERDASDDDAIRELEDTRVEAAFEAEKINIDALIAEGEARARSGTGRSANKMSQVMQAVPGLELAALSAKLTSDERNSRSILLENTREHLAADLSAESQRMLPPGTLPSPVIPFATPVAEFQMPRQFEEFDFGPRPVMGAMASPSAAANAVWGSTISGIAQTVGGMVATGFTPTGSGGGTNRTGSDRRLKENIQKLGESQSGLGIYLFNYIGNATQYIGAMADEVLKVVPEAVGISPNGYYNVDYNLIDVDFTEVVEYDTYNPIS